MRQANARQRASRRTLLFVQVSRQGQSCQAQSVNNTSAGWERGSVAQASVAAGPLGPARGGRSRRGGGGKGARGGGGGGGGGGGRVGLAGGGRSGGGAAENAGGGGRGGVAGARRRRWRG